jgi:hypothetical protein
MVTMSRMTCTAALHRDPWRRRKGPRLSRSSPGQRSAPACPPAVGVFPRVQGPRHPRWAQPRHQPFDVDHPPGPQSLALPRHGPRYRRRRPSWERTLSAR